MYIYEYENWPHFIYDTKKIEILLEESHFLQGKLLSEMKLLGLSQKNEKLLSVITSDILKSSEIEGNILNQEQVRSSVARRLGIETQGHVNSDRNVDAVVEMMLDATCNYQKPLTDERLFGWHACLFPTGYSGLHKIDVAKYRQNQMQVVSGAIGAEQVHYEALDAKKVSIEMNKFLDWVNNCVLDGFLKSAIAHLWFLTIHPFDDGNGRIARAISDLLLCRSDKTNLRFYSMSNQISQDKNSYYNILEKTQKGNLDITIWLEWFINCIIKAINLSLEETQNVIFKYKYLQSIENISLNERQRLMIQKLLSGNWFGVLNSSKWAKIAKCSSDTALRDINDLIKKGILQKEQTSGGRSTNYLLSK